MSGNDQAPRGPLHGVKILEVGGIGPNPFAGMLLADMGADVLRLDRLGDTGLAFPPEFDPTKRGRAAVAVDIRNPEGQAMVLDLIAEADALIEGYRPGVMEKLGLGPAEAHARNPRLTYGRMTGWGQDGPLAKVAGHDINYISVAGALGAIRRAGEAPLAPMNLVGDYGGGAMFLAFGVVCGVLEARSSGRGQVVDAAMVDGTALLTSLMLGLSASGAWAADRPGTNLLDSGAHFYETYETSDGGHVSVGAIEPQFYAKLIELMGLTHEQVPQFETTRWPEFKGVFAEVFRTRTRDEWAAILEHEETCATAVLTLGEAAAHPHLRARGTFVELDGVVQAQAAPRFDRTPGAARSRIAPG
ncbi:MAG: CoA transferase, partial [Solirubrobacterales bacterium]|nr:CoA transferase [Solirubrobacterales bacterium]